MEALRRIHAHLRPAHEAIPRLGSTAAEAEQPGDLLRRDVLAAHFSPEAFERDGVVCLPGVMTEPARRRMLRALQDLQALQDRVIRETDWTATDWSAIGDGLAGPESITPEDIAESQGGSECNRVRPSGFSVGGNYVQ